MLIAGIVVTIAFLLTALTLTQVSSLQREAAAEKPTPLSAEWRFLRDRLATNLQAAVTADMNNVTFNGTTFPTIAATFRNIEAEKGYDTVIRLAGHWAATNKTEDSIVAAGAYGNWSYDGAAHYTWAYDGINDGILWQQPCPDSSAPAAGCITGVMAFVHITQGQSTMEEVILFPVNQG